VRDHGRRTYEALAVPPDGACDESWHRMAELDKIIFSRTLQQVVWPNTRICGQDLVTEIGGSRLTAMFPCAPWEAFLWLVSSPGPAWWTGCG
jgi:hypothetical protein